MHGRSWSKKRIYKAIVLFRSFGNYFNVPETVSTKLFFSNWENFYLCTYFLDKEYKKIKGLWSLRFTSALLSSNTLSLPLPAHLSLFLPTSRTAFHVVFLLFFSSFKGCGLSFSRLNYSSFVLFVFLLASFAFFHNSYKE